MKDISIAKLLAQERARQEETVNLIPSENYVSADVLTAIGSVLTNKYAEGYPGKRYYPGNEIIDAVEALAQNRIKKLFRLPADWHINVQPYSGSPAMMAAYFSLLQPGETVMGMALMAGGHLTHGHRVNFSGRLYRTVQYGVDGETGLIDYDEVLRMALQHKPRVIVSGATAYPRAIDFARFGAIAKKVGAYHLADISHIAGLVVAGAHGSPFAHADVVVATTHKTLRGPRGAFIACRKDLAERVDRVVFPMAQGGPHENIIAAIAVMAYEASGAAFRRYQKQIVKNARCLADALKRLDFKLITDGTDNHLMVMDCASAGLDGMTAEKLLDSAGITANRNAIVGDASPFYPSGLRLGTPAITTRGMKEKEMEIIASWFHRVLIKKEKSAQVKKEVAALCKQFPMYQCV